MPATLEDLRDRLLRIDGRGYPAYKDIRGVYAGPGFDLIVDHVQGDPFAAPSRLRARVPLHEAGFPASMLSPRIRAVALRDFLARVFSEACRSAGERQGSGKSGMLAMARPGQEILERSSVVLHEGAVEARFTAGLPARGRRILGRQAVLLLCEKLPELVRRCLLFRSLEAAALERHLDAAEDAEALRSALAGRGLVAFVADGARLPRRSGVDDRPLDADRAVAFRGPDTLRVAIDLPHTGRVSGMGIPAGVTLVVGGGYHGKSTLLLAIERGVYNHVPGDGRELVVTEPTAVKIRAEDGRAVEGVDIGPFIGSLPGGGDPHCFRTANASGSTSQAANIMEALESGARLLLLDEDTCATNLMIRDARMQKLVEKAGEPITPFLDRVRSLAAHKGVSSILVLGGSGDYFETADTVLRMDAFVPRDVTAAARAVARELPTGRATEADGDWPEPRTRRFVDPRSMDPSRGRREVSIKTRALRAIAYGTEEIDVDDVAQLVDHGQVEAIGKALELFRGVVRQEPDLSLPEALEAVMEWLARQGLDALDSRPTGDHAAFRLYELAAALNRLRSLRVERRKP